MTEITDTRRRLWLYAVLFVAAFAVFFTLPRQYAFPLLAASVIISIASVLRFPLRYFRWFIQSITDIIDQISVRSQARLRLYSLAVLVSATLVLLPVNEERYWFVGVSLVFASVPLLARTLPINSTQLDNLPAYVPSRTRWWHIVVAVAGAAGLVLLAWLALPDQRNMAKGFFNTHLQHALLWLAVILLVYGFAGGKLRLTRPNRIGIMVLAMTVLALCIRLWQLGTALPYMVDEWLYTTAIVFLEKGDYGAPLLRRVTGYISGTHLYTYWGAVSSDWAGDGFFGLRLASVILGTLTVSAAGALGYEAARLKQQDKRTATFIGTLTALTLATLPVHIHYSRLALLTIAAPVVGTLAAALTLRAMRLNHRALYVLAGAALGLTQYFNEAGRLLMPPLFAFWIIGLLLSGHLPEVRARWRGVLLAASVAMLIGIVPWAVNGLSGEPMLTRFNVGSNMLDEGVSLADRYNLIRRSLPGAVTTLTSRPDPTGFFGGSQPFIPAWMLLPFLFGVGVMLAQWREPAYLLILVWIALTILGNSLLQKTSTPRYVIVAPPVALTAVIGLYYLLKHSIRQQWVLTSTVSIMMALSVVNVVYYYRVAVPSLIDEIHELLIERRFYSAEYMLRTLRHNIPEGAYIHVIHDEHQNPLLVAVSQFVEKPAITFIDTDEQNVTPAIADLRPNWAHVVFVKPNDSDSLAQIKALYTLDGPYYIEDDTPEELRMMMYIIVDRKPALLDEAESDPS